MKDHQDYIRDIAEIRSMMERSSKFLSLSGWAGIMAGIYALAGAYIAYSAFSFNPDQVQYSNPAREFDLSKLIFLGLFILILALATAVMLSGKRAQKTGGQLWNATSRRLLIHLAVPLVAGGVLILILMAKDLVGLAAPLSLIFYGMALYNAGKFTYDEVKVMGLIQMGLGLISAWLIPYSLLIWAFGFGVVHIIYGIYMFKYER